MSSVEILSAAGKKQGTVELDDAVFGVQPNVPVMHQVVTAQLAARRSGTQNTKTRAEVRGGGAKPWRQKGTGRARQGSIRSPQWRGGGVALGPKPRSYVQRTPKKMVRLALLSALSDRAADGKVLVVDWGFTAPRTKDAVAALAALEVTGRALVVLPADAEGTWKSFRNLGNVHICTPNELNAYDVLVSDWVIFTPDTLPSSKPVAADAETTVAAPKAKKAKKAEPKASEQGEADGGAAQAPAGAADADDSDLPKASEQGEAADPTNVTEDDS